MGFESALTTVYFGQSVNKGTRAEHFETYCFKHAVLRAANGEDVDALLDDSPRGCADCGRDEESAA